MKIFITMNSNKKLVWIVVVIVVVVLIVWTAQNKTSTGTQTIKIGAISSLSGGAAPIGEQARNAIVLAEEQINAQGGIDGNKLDIIIEDGGCDGAKALSAWQKLVSVDNVKVVLGGHCSTESLAIAPLTSQNGVVALADITSSTAIPNEGEWLFRNSPPNDYYAQIGGRFAYAHGVKSLAILTEQKDYSIDYSKNFKDSFSAAGGTVIDEESFLADASDFRSVLAKLKAESFDGILLSSQSAKTMGLIVNQMHDLQLDGVAVIFSGGFSADTFLKTTGGYVPAKAWGIAPYVDATSSTTKPFMDAYAQRFGQPITFNPFYIAATYDMVFRLKAALEGCGANPDNTACIRDYFKGQKEWNGASGKITFDSNFHPMVPLAEVTIVNGKEVDVPISY